MKLNYKTGMSTIDFVCSDVDLCKLLDKMWSIFNIHVADFNFLAWLMTWYSTCLRNRPFFSGISSTWIVSLVRSCSNVCEMVSTSS